MELDIYWIGLFVLTPLAVLAVGYQDFLRPMQAKRTEELINYHDLEAKKFRRTFLRVYLLVMGSEWFQGPYLYSLFRDEKALGQRTVAVLYIATYFSAAISAFMTGYVADRFGRRAACFIFCGIHSLASISVKSNAIEILIIGRVLSGISLNLLWTVFESWMVAEYNARTLNQSSFPLSAMFGIMTRYNCIAAILAGIVGHFIVRASGSKANPFVVGVIIDASAALLILTTWNENKGISNNLDSYSQDSFSTCNTTSSMPAKKPMVMLRDPRIWVLSFVSCCFEGTIFIFTFFWPRTLREAHDKQHPGRSDATPYGAIFASFMAVMVLGAILFSLFTQNRNSAATGHTSTFTNVSPTVLLGMALFLGALSLLVVAFSKADFHLFLAFLLLEFCNGVYVPSMAYHRGMIVENPSRTLVYGLMNVPLFVFVTIALYTTSSDGEYRQIVFVSSAILLLIAGVAIVIGLRILTDRPDDGDSIGKNEVATRNMNQIN